MYGGLVMFIEFFIFDFCSSIKRMVFIRFNL